MTGPDRAPPAMTARALRRLTRQFANSDGGASAWSVVADLYTALLSAALSVLLLLGIALQSGAVMPQIGGPQRDAPAALPWLALTLSAAFAGSLLGRLGPVGADGAEVIWWFGSPVPRGGLLRPRLWQAGALTAALLAVGWPLALLAAGAGARAAGWDAASYAALAVMGAATGLGLTGLLAGLERTPGLRRAVTYACDAALLAPVIAAVATWRRLSLPSPGPASPVAAAVMATAAAGLMVWAGARLPAVPIRVLHQLGTAMGAAAAAFRSLDSRELSRSFQDAFAQPRPHRSSRLLAFARGPVSSLIAADWLTLARAPRRWLQLLLAACVPVLLAQLSWQAPPLAARMLAGAGLVAGGYLAALTVSEPARQAFRAPVLDALAPMSAQATRLTRLVVPGLVLAVWGALAGALSGVAEGAAHLALIMALAAPVLAAAGLRAAYREPPDWSGPLLITPQGAFPPQLFSVLREGPDLALPGMIPVVLALLPGISLPLAVALQLAAAAGALALTAHSGRAGTSRPRRQRGTARG